MLDRIGSVIAGRILAEVGDIAWFATKDTYAAHPCDLNGQSGGAAVQICADHG